MLKSSVMVGSRIDPVLNGLFYAFGFVMFSCAFPTGVSATLSTLAFVLACVKMLLVQKNLPRLHMSLLIGLALFAWLALTLVWSEGPLVSRLSYLFEYRIYFMAPVFFWALGASKLDCRTALLACMSGAIIALLASFSLWLGVLQVEGAHLSLANRIYHGFAMSALLVICIYFSILKVNNVVLFLVAALVIFNVLFIETGRTGYLQILSVVILFMIYRFKGYQLVLSLLFSLICFTFIFSVDSSLKQVIFLTISNLNDFLAGRSLMTSAGLRLEFYRNGLDVFQNHVFFGVGVGDVAQALQNRFEAGQMRAFTDNVHSEYLNMAMAGGSVALLLFCAFWLSIFRVGVRLRKSNQDISFLLVGVVTITIISAFFNSTIKDYGEKHALIYLLPVLMLMASRVMLPSTASAPDESS